MNELMKKHKAAVAQVPCPGAPTAPCATGTDPIFAQWQCFRPLALRVGLEWGTSEGYGGSCSALTPFPGLPGPGSDE